MPALPTDAAPLPAPPRARWRAIRPAEWVELAFLLFIGANFLAHPVLPSGKSIASVILQAPLLVLLIQQVSRYVRTPWPDEVQEGTLRLYRIFLALCAAPLVLQAIDLTQVSWSTDEEVHDVLNRILLFSMAFIRVVTLAGAPSLLLGVGIGLHLKAHGGVSWKALPGEIRGAVAGPIRDWLPPTVLAAAYTWVGFVFFSAKTHAVDATLAGLDVRVFGTDPVLWLDEAVGRWSGEWLTFSYATYFLGLALCPAILYLRADRRPFHELALAYTLAFALGYVGYAAIPARGPAFFLTYANPLPNIHMAFIQTALVEPNLIPCDAFPSLHTAFALLFLWSMWRHARRVFWVLAPAWVCIPIACVYLRYHYAMDVMAGTLLAIVVMRVTPALQKRWEAGQPRA